MVDETRNQMMQNLFGEQSEDEEEEEEEVDSEHAAAAAAVNHSDYQSDEGEHEGENDDAEGEGGGEIEGQGEVEMESEAEAYDVDAEEVESEGERAQSSPEREISDQKMESQPKYAESEDEGYGQRVVTSRRRDVVASESDESGNHYADHEGEEVDSDQYRKSRTMDDQQDHEVVRDVFGDSDEEELPEYGGHDEIEQDLHRSPVEETNYERDARPEDVVPDEDMQYQSEEDNFEEKPKDKPVGPPLDLEVPLQEPPGRPDKMNVIKVSNIMGIEPKPFDPKTYVEEDVFVTDESGAKKRIRLEDNIVRCRMIKNRDGTVSYESNARFVRWKDGSLQLLIGNEVLDISVHDAHQDQSHLFLRHGKGILQSQGRLLQKMKFMPSSLLSKSHRLLTALVDSRHKKVYKVKNCITEIDPEKEKEEKERVEGQTIRANEVLHRKREKVNRKYAQPVHRGRQLSPGFLEDALDEEDESDDYYNSRRTSARSRFEEDLDGEARAERRIISAKKSNVHSNVPRKAPMSSARPSRRPLEESESEREESEYESDGEEVDRSPAHAREDGADHEDEYEEEADEEAADAIYPSEEDEDEEPRGKKETGSNTQKRKEIDSDESPPRKTTVHRRKAIVFDSDEE